MKLTYYKYWIWHNNFRYRHNLLPLLEVFTSIDDPVFRQSIRTKEQGEAMMLYKLRERLFLFMVSKPEEIIKTIDAAARPHDIYEKLNQDEKLCFASYIYFTDRYFAMASTFHGPRSAYFLLFIKKLLSRLGLSDIIIEAAGFPSESTREQVLNFDFKGEIYFEIDRTNPWFIRMLSNLFGNEVMDSSVMAIHIKPEPRQQMRQSFDQIVSNIPEEGLRKLTVKARPDMEDALSEFCIIGKNYIQDVLSGSRSEDSICSEIIDKIENNSELHEKVKEYERERGYSDENLPALAHFNNVDNWGHNILTS